MIASSCGAYTDGACLVKKRARKDMQVTCRDAELDRDEDERTDLALATI